MNAPPVERHTYNLGIVGNCAYMAHIDERANVVWMCWPRFDSSFIFGSLLDPKKGGRFSILPEKPIVNTRQRYLKNSNVLETTFDLGDQAFRVTDFAPRFKQHDRFFRPLMLIRKIEPIRGNPSLRVICNPMGEYGEVKPELLMGSNHIRYSGVGQNVRLTTNISLNSVMEEQNFVLNEVKYLVLTSGPPLEAPLAETSEEFLRKTLHYWQEWVFHSSIGDFFQEEVIRSALVLKLHQYDDTGAIIASGTTSLPEAPGSGRNWDYRYCWLRDSYYTLTALNNIGQYEELDGYSNYIQNIAASGKKYQPVYSITGDTEIIEKTLELEGYLKNGPVRIGNDARTHIQNDLYGQILVALLPLFIDNRFLETSYTSSLLLIDNLLTHIERTMDEPDAGLWEFRNIAQKHCYTFLFHWAGSSAAAKIARYRGDNRLLEKANLLAARASEQIEKCYDESRGAYMQAIGSKNLDASLLQLITMGYLDPNSEKTRRHLQAIEKELRTDEGLVFRYVNEDDFGKPEVTFLVCGFWYTEALACVGRIEDATREFEKLIRYSNNLGLFSEDVDAKTGSQWGNFPQTYSHVGLMNAAFRIVRKLDRPPFL